MHAMCRRPWLRPRGPPTAESAVTSVGTRAAAACMSSRGSADSARARRRDTRLESRADAAAVKRKRLRESETRLGRGAPRPATVERGTRDVRAQDQHQHASAAPGRRRPGRAAPRGDRDRRAEREWSARRPTPRPGPRPRSYATDRGLTERYAPEYGHQRVVCTDFSQERPGHAPLSRLCPLVAQPRCGLRDTATRSATTVHGPALCSYRWGSLALAARLPMACESASRRCEHVRSASTARWFASMSSVLKSLSWMRRLAFCCSKA